MSNDLQTFSWACATRSITGEGRRRLKLFYSDDYKTRDVVIEIPCDTRPLSERPLEEGELLPSKILTTLQADYLKNLITEATLKWFPDGKIPSDEEIKQIIADARALKPSPAAKDTL